VDGIVFVADSDPTRLAANLSALLSIRQALESNGQNPDKIPFVFQHNKRDLPGAVFPDQIDAALSIQTPTFLGCALSGYQVFATLDHLSQIVLNNFHTSTVKGREQIHEEIVASSVKIALSR
jgi:mutual gliding-motility protein MglA